MRHLVVTLLRNLNAGIRMALFRPLGASDFRVTLGALLALIAFDLALEIVLDGVRIGHRGGFNADALQHYALAVSTLFVASGVLALAFGQAHRTLALVVALAASGLVVTLVGFGLRLWSERAVGQWTPTLAWAVWVTWIALMAWSVAVAGRALAVMLAPRSRVHVVAGAALLFATGYIVQTEFHDQDWWYPQRAEQPVARASPVTEEALVRQPQLLAESLAALGEHRAGVVDLYFVGFGGDGSQDVFRKDVEAAQAAVHERFDIDGRAIALINNPDTLRTAPLATASNLRAALRAIGSKIDRDEDIVLVFLTSHGSRDHKLMVEFRPLKLDHVDGTALRRMLDDAGIRWRIVVISACYAGGFIPALAEPHTLVMAAAAADRTSFGCSTDSEMTYFTEALFKHALPTEASFTGAFAKAHALVSARERAEGLTPPSDPQLFVGDAIAAKLDALGRRSVACSGGAC